MSVESNILEMVAERAETEDLTLLPLSERCRLISEFSDALVETGCAGEAASTDSIDERKFASEIKVLKRLAHTLSYSDSFIAWIRHSEKLLLEQLKRKNPATRLRRDWQNADQSERWRMVQKVLDLECKTFSETLTFKIPEPRMKWLTNAKPRTKAKVSFDYEVLERGEYPAIELRESLFTAPAPDEAFGYGLHEVLHYTLFTLSMHAHHGRISSRAALYHDTRMETEKIKAGAIIPSFLDSAYRAQPEERLCYGLQKKMTEGWLAPA